MNKTYNLNVIPPEIRAKMYQAEAVAAAMAFRDLKCPHCGFRVERVFADTAGHFQIKCRKCKEETVYNLTPGTVCDFRLAK